MQHAYIATALAVLLGLGAAVAGAPGPPAPAAAQQPKEPEPPAAGTEAEAGETITPEELGRRAEERFGAIAGGAAELSREQLAAAMPELDNEDIAALFQEIDADASGGVSRAEWRAWSERLFGEAGGAAGLTIEQYQEWLRTGRITL